MAYGLKARYDRTDKRQASRDQQQIAAQWDKICMEFEELLFDEGFDEKLFQAFNERWIKWAEYFNNKKVISLANPRAFYDEYINQNYHNWAEVEQEADIKINYISL